MTWSPALGIAWHEGFSILVWVSGRQIGSAAVPMEAPMSVSNLVWLLVVVLVIAWLLGFTVFNLGNIVHLLLVLIVLAVIYNVMTGRRAA